MKEGLNQKREANEEKPTEVVHYDDPPKRARFFSAINPTTSACRRFACIRRNHSSDKDAYPDYQVSMVRVPIRHDQSSLSFALARLHHDTRYLSSEMNHYQRPALLAGRPAARQRIQPSSRGWRGPGLGGGGGHVLFGCRNFFGRS